jgi:hypothetical protein
MALGCGAFGIANGERGLGGEPGQVDAADADGDEAAVRAKGWMNAPTPLATGERSPGGIAVDSERVYWANDHDTDGRVRVVAKSGGAPHDVATGIASPSNVVLDATFVYWKADSHGQCVPGIERRRKDDSTDAGPSVLASCQDIFRERSMLAIDGLNVYWSSPFERAVYSLAKVGFTVATVASPATDAGAQSGVDHVAVNGTSIFWTRPPDGLVIAFDKMLQTVSAVAEGEAMPRALACDDSGVFWTTATAIRGRPLAPEGPTFTLASGLNAPTSIAIDDENVYWATAGDGLIRAAPRRGGPSTTLASGQMDPSSIAVDASGLYWTTVDGNVMHLARVQ